MPDAPPPYVLVARITSILGMAFALAFGLLFLIGGFFLPALAAFAAKAIIEPGKKVHLQYTTTSPLMQKRLGVAGEE